MNINDIPFKLKNINVFKIKSPKDTITMIEGKTLFMEEDIKKVKEGIPYNFKLDEYSRTAGGMAILEYYTSSPLVNKKLIYPDPSNWEKIDNAEEIFNKCHAVAYSLFSKKNDELNIFIGTNYMNKRIMQIIEKDIYKKISNNKEKILYRARPVYKNDEIIPRGILIEVKSLIDDDKAMYYCPNIEKNVKFDYNTGTIILDKRNAMSKALEKHKAKKRYNIRRNEELKEKQTNYNIELNRKTGIFHIEGCKKMNGINPKYINEIRTSKKAMLKKFKPCSCTNKIK